MGDILTKYRSFWICLALTLATAAVFYQVYTHDFINYDDPAYVYENPNIQAGITPKTIKWAFTAGYAANWHPLTWLSHMLDWQLFGPNPAGHHLANLIFHIANTLLLFVVLKQMTQKFWPSVFVAALFALHPLHVESVAWVSERKDVLSTFFWMLTMWAYVRFVSRPKVARYLLVVVFFALGLMAKPMLVTLPFVLLLLDYWPLARIPLRQKKKQVDNRLRRQIFYRLIWEKVPFFVLSAASSAVTLFVQRSGKAMIPFTAFSLRGRLFNAVISYVEYMGKMVWPSRLAVFYPHPSRDMSLFFAVISAVLLLAVTILILRFAENHRYLVTGWFWYLGTLVPVIGFVQVGLQAIADRYTYVPLTGLFIIIAWGLPDLLAKWRYKKIVLLSSAMLVVLAVSMCTYFQLRYWRNTAILLQHTIDVTKDNFVAINNLAWSLAVSPEITEHNPDKAIRLARHACELTHYSRPESLDTLAVSYAAGGAFDKAIEAARKALQLCQSSGQKTLRDEIKNRLVLYKAGKPYIEAR